MKILEFLEYDKTNILEVEYLLEFLNKLSALEQAKDAIIIGQPQYLNGKRVESISTFHKRSLINTILIELTSNYAKKFNYEDVRFVLSCSDLWDNPYSELSQFILKNDFSQLTAAEIQDVFNEKLFLILKNNNRVQGLQK